jgi:hypothetical protein
MARGKNAPTFDADAYGQGYDAYCNGHDIGANPYDADQNHVAHRSWEAAWREGSEQDGEEIKSILAEAGQHGTTLEDLLSKLDSIEPRRCADILIALVRSEDVLASEGSDGTAVYRVASAKYAK